MGRSRPKPLIPVRGIPLIERAIRSLCLAGIDEIAVVVGPRAPEVVQGLAGWRAISSVRLSFVENPRHELPNGVSVRAASRFVTERTLLVMADHVFSPRMVAPLCALDSLGDSTVLAVDRDLEGIFDLSDATKVGTNGTQLRDIGKQLRFFDAVDTGLFAISPLLCRALSVLDAPELSDGVRALAQNGLVDICDVTGSRWVDVDTPLARLHAERLLERLGDDLEEPCATVSPTSL